MAKKATKKTTTKRSKKTGDRPDRQFSRGELKALHESGELLYIGLRNIRTKSFNAAKDYAKATGSNAGTVISDALDQYLKARA